MDRDLRVTARAFLQNSQTWGGERTRAVFKDLSVVESTRIEWPALIWDVVLVGLAGTLLAMCSP